MTGTRKQLNNKSVHKVLIFKEKILQDLAETSNNIFKRCIYYLKFTKDLLMLPTDQLYRTLTRLRKRIRSFWIFILKALCRKAGPI